MIDSDKRNMIGWSEEAKENAKWQRIIWEN